ncbi:proline-rich protein 36-like [Eriocheir sinensis]|uniref:proline-rich protein 36-like n=1 Tax=Eriocheir sinensis TaxID=95602 RepID=UPI0021CAC9D9|nr:proline-rich protein 36-like [Eriocheir sinensis]
MRCYKLGSHTSKDCPKPANFLLCSECGTEGHRFGSCTVSTAGVITATKEAKTTSQSLTYSGAAASASPSPTLVPALPTNLPTILPSTINTIFTCVTHAHFQNAISPGSYESSLNSILTANNLPPIIIPEIPDSQKLFTLATQPAPAQAPTTAEPPPAHDLQEIAVLIPPPEDSPPTSQAASHSSAPASPGEHHAWNRACANRRELVDKQRTVQQRWVVTHRPAPLCTFCWGAQQPPASTAAPTPRLSQAAHQLSLTNPSPVPYEESFPPLTPRHLPPPPPAQLTAPQAPNASRQPRRLTTAAPTAAPPGCLLITREMMVGLLEGFGWIIATAIKSDVEPRVFSDAAQQVVGNLFPETPAKQAVVPPVQAPSPGRPSSTPPTPTPRALKTPLPPPPAPVHASSSAPLPTPPPVATSQHYPLVAPPPAPTSLNAGGLPTRPVMARYGRSRKLSV